MVGVVVGILGLVMGTVGAATSLTDGTVFELDGNAVSDPLLAGDDWDKVFGGTDSALASTGILADGTCDLTQFQGGGSKDNQDVTAWRWAKPGCLPDKDEITNAYATAYAHDGRLFLYFGMDRYATSGSANIGFWFFQDRIGLGPHDGNNSAFTGSHELGDVLVVAEFTNGGATVEVDVYEWVGSGGSEGSLDKIASGARCQPGSPANVCAVTNTDEIPAPWPYTPKSGTEGHFPELTFFEGGVDLTAIFDEPGCFASFMAVTRSSHEVNATLKDFALGQLGVCDANISISPLEDANQVGDDHELEVTVQKQDASTGYSLGPAADVTVSASLEGPGAFKDGVSTCTTGGDGTCTLTIVSSTTGLTSVTATADIPVNGESLTVTTDGTGDNSGPAVKRWVDARLSLDPPEAANQVGDTHTFTAHLEFDYGDGEGFVDAPDGETITFALADGHVGTLASSTCTTGNDGTCPVDLDSDDTGLDTLTASWTGLIGTDEGDAQAAAAADGKDGNGDVAVKRWVDARLSLDPPEAANQVGDTHTFTAHLEFDYGTGNFVNAPAGETITFALADGHVGNLADTSCTTGSDGTCPVDLDSDDTGLDTLTASWTGLIGTDEGDAQAAAAADGKDGNGDVAVKRWVDAQLELSPSPRANQVGDTHTFTAHLQFDYGDGEDFVDAPDGEAITFSHVSGLGELEALLCQTEGGDGTCTVDLDSAVTGLDTVVASWNGLIATAEGDAEAKDSSDDAVKRWVDAQLELTPSPRANQVGDTHTFTAQLKFDYGTGQGFVNAPAGQTITFSHAPGGVGELAAAACLTVAGGTCTVDLDSDVTGLDTVGASWSGVISTDEGDAEAAVSTDGTKGNSGPAVKRWVDAQLTINPSEEANRVGDPHTFTAHLKFDHGTGQGFVNAPANETISFALAPGGVGTLRPPQSCATEDDTGSCQIILDSDDPGLDTVGASWSGTISTDEGDAEAAVSTDGTKGNSGPAVKRWLDAQLTLEPAVGVNQLGDPHEFTAHLQFNTGGGWVDAAGETITFSKDGPGTFASTPAECVTGGNGTCTIVLDSDVVGLTTVTASWSGGVVTDEGTVQITLDADAVKHWVDLDALISIDPPQAANQVDDPHEFTITVFKKDSSTDFAFEPAAGALVTTTASGVGSFVGSNGCTTDSDGTCTVTINSALTGLTTVSASADVLLVNDLADDVTVTVVTDGEAGNSAPAVKRWVDAQLTLEPLADANQVGDPHTFTARLSFDHGKGGGFVNAPAGQAIDFSLAEGSVGTLRSAGTCSTVGDTGACQIVLDSTQTGLSTVTASWSGVISTDEGDAEAGVSTDGTKGNSGPAVKRWVDAQLTLDPLADANQVGDTHTFTASLRFDRGTVAGFVPAPAGQTINFSHAGGGVGELAATSCVTVAGGTCTVDLDSDLTGLDTVSASWNGLIDTAEGDTEASVSTDGTKDNSGPAVKRWVDARLLVTPPDATNVIGDTHVFTAQLQFDHGVNGGWVDAPADQTIVFSIAGGPGAFTDGDTCVTDDGGNCTVDLDSAEVGLTTVNATWAGEIGTAEGSATATASSDDAQKLWVNPAITIVKTATPDVGPPRPVTYSYEVTNTGDVLLTNVDVTDDILGFIGTIASLEPGESATLSRTEDVDETTPVVNVGTACGDPTVDGEVIGAQVCASDDATISVVLGVQVVRLPRTGLDIHLGVLLSSLLLWLGAASLTLHARLRRRI